VWPSQLEHWQRDLSSPLLERRLQAVKESGREPSLRLVSLVARALEDSDEYVQRAAAQVVAKHRYHLAEKVVPWLDSDSTELKFAAARVLVRVPFEPASDALKRLLFDKDTGLRQAAVSALDRLGSPQATTALLFALNDSSDSVRKSAIRCLSYRIDSRIDAALTGKLTDIEPTVRADVVRALVARGSLEDETLRRQVLVDKSDWVRLAAVFALGRQPEKQTTSLFFSLITDDQSPNVLRAATVVLVGREGHLIGPELFLKWRNLERGKARTTIEAVVREVPRLASGMSEICFRDTDVEDITACLGFCGKWGCDVAQVVTLAKARRIPPESVLEVCGRVGSPDCLDWVLGQLDWSSPRRLSLALDALERILETRPSGLVIDSLVQGLTALRVDSELLQRVVRLLGLSGSSRAKALLLPIALDGTNPESLVVEAITALGRLGTEGLDASLWSLLNHSSERVAATVATVFFATKTKFSPLALFEQADLSASRRSLRFIVLSSLLASTNETKVWPEFERRLAWAEGGERDALIEGLARNASPTARAMIQKLLLQATVADRRKVAEAWGAGEETLSLLGELATDPAPSVRANALWSLGRLGRRRHWDTLALGLKDPVVEVRSNAIVALGRIAERERASVKDQACPLISSQSSTLQEAALIALRLAKERCPGGQREQVLLRADEESVRRSAALLIASTRQASDTTALALCSSFDPSPTVRGFCDGKGLVVTSERDLLPQLVYLVPEGPRGAVSNVEYGVSGEGGLLRFGLTDRRGAFFTVGWKSEGLLVRPLPADATLLE
jgi:HEAT repeat protein